MDITLSSSHIGGTIFIPASKSQTIRALLIATFAEGESLLVNPLDSQDTRSCLDACKAFGAEIIHEDNALRVIGKGLPKKPVVIDCGNSGTTLYLATAMASASDSPITFTGDEQLSRRPVGNLLNSLVDLGVKVKSTTRQTPPFTVQGPIIGGTTSIECPTSQYLSALMLGLPLAKNDTTVLVPLLNERPYVSMTKAYLDDQDIEYWEYDDMAKFVFRGNQKYRAFTSIINGDYSSASFFFCAAAITGDRLEIKGLDPNDPQGDKEILSILSAMGCSVSYNGVSTFVQGPPRGTLVSGQFDLNTMPDALPILAVAACFAKGTTILSNVPQARIKETDRISCMRSVLDALGADVEELPDGLVIHGTGALDGGVCSGYGDHRIIMASAIASLGCRTSVTIKGIDAAGVTFPTFFKILENIKHYVM